MSALDDFALLEVLAGNSAHTDSALVKVRGLNTGDATEGVIAGFLPFCNQGWVGPPLLQQPLIEFPGNLLLLIVLLEDESRPLMIQPDDLPERLVFAFAFVRFTLGFAHSTLDVFEHRLDVVPA